MLDQFKKVSKADWLAKVEKDLKGKPLDSLDWQLEGSVYTPFFHADDLAHAGATSDQSTNEWQICEVVYVDTIATARTQALAALEKGANALSFQLQRPLTEPELTELLEGIHLEWIHTHFEGPADAMADLPAMVHAVVTAKKERGYNVSCSFAQVPADQIETIDEELPLAAIYLIEEPTGVGQSAGLAAMLLEASDYLSQLEASSIEIQSWSQKLMFRVYTSDDFFVTIAKIRALQLLWAQLMYAWQGTETHSDTARVEAVARVEEADSDEHTNKVRLTNRAMAAAVAGVERLTIYPSDQHMQSEGDTFSRRIALNIHHLLQQESYLHQVVDPASGSYYIETLTNDLAEAAWSIFQKESEA